MVLHPAKNATALQPLSVMKPFSASPLRSECSPLAVSSKPTEDKHRVWDEVNTRSCHCLVHPMPVFMRVLFWPGKLHTGKEIHDILLCLAKPERTGMTQSTPSVSLTISASSLRSSGPTEVSVTSKPPSAQVLLLQALAGC